MEKNQLLVKEKNFNQAREKIKKLRRENPNEEIIFQAEGRDINSKDELNRKIIDKGLSDIILINLSERKDFQKQRNSGLNHVMAKSAKKAGIKIGINFEEILECSDEKDDKKEKAKILGRLQQNINLCKKNNLQMKFIFPSSIKDSKESERKKDIKRNKRDLKSLGKVLGMPTWMLKEVV